MPAVVLAVVLTVMVAVRIGNYRLPARAQPVIGPLAALALLALGTAAGADVGLGGLGPDGAGPGGSPGAGVRYASAAAGAVAAAYALLLVLPPGRRALRRSPPARHAWRVALLEIPLATVAFEEAAFRGVLWGLIEDGHGPLWATGVTAVLFGLWHRGLPDIAGTALAGVLLGLLREAGGGLLAPVALHWAANGFGVLAVACAGSRRSTPPDDEPEVA